MQEQRTISLQHGSDVYVAVREAKSLAAELGFDDNSVHEMGIVASELGTNVLIHAGRGSLTLGACQPESAPGIVLESFDMGSSIPDFEQALRDGYTTSHSLGCGLGAINRLMDELDCHSNNVEGTRIRAVRYLRNVGQSKERNPLDIGAAIRPHPGMKVCGDSVVHFSGDGFSLVAVIDGLGHGPEAHLASRKAEQYVSTHFDRPLTDVFLGVARNCRGTRGVVMAVARIDWRANILQFASVGNIEARLFLDGTLEHFLIQRGVLGGAAPPARSTLHGWNAGAMLVLHSDGLSTGWRIDDYPELWNQPAAMGALLLLRKEGKMRDDAAIIVVKGRRQ